MFEPEIYIVTVGMIPFGCAEAMPLVGIKHELELFPKVHELADELYGILHMDVVVQISVRHEQDSFHVLCMCHRRPKRVAFLVFTRPIHIALCVDRIIEMPVGDG